MRKNILFNTTRQWNIGDQIIMLGILNILKRLNFNIFIYNRHPSIYGTGKDNSFVGTRHNLENIDYYIAAGTPEWADQKLKPLYEEIAKRRIPRSFIGIGGVGCGYIDSFPALKNLFMKADILSARDSQSYEIIKQFGGIKLPCPGFLCGQDPVYTINENPVIGLVFTTDKTNPNTISTELKQDLINGYKKIIEKREAFIICHFIDEALEARTHFPNTPIFYSYDARDYEKPYSWCDLVISPRLHGALLSAGLGVPT